MPTEVIARTPNPEMLPGIHDTNLVLAVAAATADLVLWGIEHGMDDRPIADAVERAEHQVAELRRVIDLSAHMRTPSRCPPLDL